jgi:hypothetical protein
VKVDDNSVKDYTVKDNTVKDNNNVQKEKLELEMKNANNRRNVKKTTST